MTYTYQDLCEWRKEAQIELKKYRAKMGKTKAFSDKLEKAQKGTGLFSKICRSGVVEQILDRIGK